MILYLHGFRSSPHSAKARAMAARMRELGLADSYYCPQLPASPEAAVGLALEWAERQRGAQPPQAALSIVGSSLGGFYATWLAERLGCRAVLLNPAVQPPRDLRQYVGVSTQFHSDQPFEFKAEYVAQLRAIRTRMCGCISISAASGAANRKVWKGRRSPGKAKSASRRCCRRRCR